MANKKAISKHHEELGRLLRLARESDIPSQRFSLRGVESALWEDHKLKLSNSKLGVIELGRVEVGVNSGFTLTFLKALLELYVCDDDTIDEIYAAYAAAIKFQSESKVRQIYAEQQQVETEIERARKEALEEADDVEDTEVPENSENSVDPADSDEAEEND